MQAQAPGNPDQRQVRWDKPPDCYTRIMVQSHRFTAIIEREDDGFVSLCPELDIASQGSSIEEARANLVEALSLFLETADPSEVARRFRSEIFVTQVEVSVG